MDLSFFVVLGIFLLRRVTFWGVVATNYVGVGWV